MQNKVIFLVCAIRLFQIITIGSRIGLLTIIYKNLFSVDVGALSNMVRLELKAREQIS